MDKKIRLSVAEGLRALRERRGLTQEKLAIRSVVSVESVRRVEAARMSPSLETIRKLCAGLQISCHTFFKTIDRGRSDPMDELADLLSASSQQQRKRALAVLQALFELTPRPVIG